MPEPLASERAIVGKLVGDNAESWDLAGELPVTMLRELGARKLLCAEVPASYGGLGSTSRLSGEFTAYVGSLCSSVRSVMTSHGMAAWTVQRLGDPHLCGEDTWLGVDTLPVPAEAATAGQRG